MGPLTRATKALGSDALIMHRENFSVREKDNKRWLCCARGTEMTPQSPLKRQGKEGGGVKRVKAGAVPAASTLGKTAATSGK